MFLVAYLFMFSGISRTATHFTITVKKNVLQLLCVNYMSCSYFVKKLLFKLISKSLEIFCKFQAWPNLIYKTRSGMQKKSVQNQSACSIEKQQLLFAFYYLNRAGGFHFQSISIEIFLSEKFAVSGRC